MLWLGKQIWCQDETGLEVAVWLACCVRGGREELMALVVVQLE